MTTIKVNGYTIFPAQVAMLDRKQRHIHGDRGKTEDVTGVFVRFIAGGTYWIPDPEAKAVEQAFAAFDGVQSAELPY